MKVEEFYNTISKEYTDLLDRAISKYNEMLWTVFYIEKSKKSSKKT